MYQLALPLFFALSILSSVESFAEDRTSSQQKNKGVSAENALSRLQQYALRAVGKGIRQYEKRNPENEGVLEVCFIVIEHTTGEVAASVNGRNYPASAVDHCEKPRQTGTLFKTFVLAAALEYGNGTMWSLSSEVLDLPLCYEYYRRGKKINVLDPVYCPQNYALEDPLYAGKITLKKAFEDSRNAAFLWLGNIIGIDWIVETVERFGIPIPKSQRRHAALILGITEVSPLRMAQAFSVFANDGVLIIPNHDQRTVITQKTAARLQMALRGVVVNGTAQKGKTIDSKKIYGKTGTTSAPDPENKERGKTIDAWFCGFDEQYTVCVWTGFDDQENIGTEESGGRTALPFFVHFMEQLHGKKISKKAEKTKRTNKTPRG